MAKAKGANFVLTFPLRPTEHQLSVLDTQFNVVRQLYHLVLGEALRRWKSVRHTAKYGKLQRCIRAVLRKQRALNMECEDRTQKRAKNNTINPTTGKARSKKRYGKRIAHKARGH